MAVIGGHVEMGTMNARCEFSSGQKPVERSDLVGRLSNSGLLTLEANSNFLPGFKRALSVPTTSSLSSLDKTTSSTKPTFRIQLPSRTHTSLSLPARPTQQITPITATHFPNSLGEDHLFSSFRSTALLTPPDERLHPPLDSAVHEFDPLPPTSTVPSLHFSSLQPPIPPLPISQSTGFSNRSQSPNPPDTMAEVPSTNPAGAKSELQTPTGNAAAQELIETHDSANAPHWLANGLDAVRK